MNTAYLMSYASRFISFIASILFILPCQGQTKKLHILASKEQVDSILHNIILDQHYIEKEKALRVVFSFKVDSSGEIHSAHVRWSVNLLPDAYYSICRSIENTINAKFMYKKCSDAEVVKKY
ncbi:MAG: hypothetical protein AAF734_04960, partial [Bacteroidota bacterium]